MRVCPSILEYKTEDYLATIKKLVPYYKYFQLDFADGIYVDNKTASLDNFIKLISNHLSLVTDFVFDFHLMVKNYEEDIKKLEGIKNLIIINNILIHYDLLPKSSLAPLKSGFTIGLVLNPQDQVSDLATHYKLQDIPCIQIMSVVPGAQGKPFVPETLNKIEQLRALGYRSKIFLDGAVNDKTLPIINSKKYLPDVICPGSFLAKSPDNELKKRVDYLLEFTNED